MPYPFVNVTASEEIVKHIKVLDREESWLRKQASQQRSRADEMDQKADLLAAKRRQFEFLVGQLNDANPTMPADPFPGPQTAVLGQLSP